MFNRQLTNAKEPVLWDPVQGKTTAGERFQRNRRAPPIFPEPCTLPIVHLHRDGRKENLLDSCHPFAKGEADLPLQPLSDHHLVVGR